MSKKKKDTSCQDDGELSVPLPIQTFLWRQTSPFIRPKFGKLHESSCMEQREACKSFEKVLVQNIQFGLSPSLTEAIKSISRWRLVQASLPYVMHCCAALLYQRKDRCLDKLGAAETKLLYTLHWILLDAADECADSEANGYSSLQTYLFPISVIQVFIYLFAPLTEFMKYSEFMTSFRLENGLKIWQPLWEFQHPNVPCFTSLVCPKRHFFKPAEDHFIPTSFGNVFLGAGDIDLNKSNGFPAPKTATSTPSQEDDIKCNKTSKSTESFRPEKKNKSFISSDVCMATYLDVAVLRCLFISQWLEEGVHWALQYLYNRFQSIAEKRAEEIKPRKRSNSLPIPKIEITFYQSPEHTARDCITSVENTELFTLDSSYFPSHHTSLQELCHFSGLPEKPKQKRNKIGDFRSFVEEKLRLSERVLDKIVKDEPSPTFLIEDNEQNRVSIIKDSISINIEMKDSLSLSELCPPRPQSALGLLQHKSEKTDDVALPIKTEMIRGKSLPSLHISEEKRFNLPESFKTALRESKKVPAFHTHSVPNPIITVTEHSPVASVQFFLNQESVESPREDSPPVSTIIPICRQLSITRSQTDSNIAYNFDMAYEAAGSTYYITKDGEIDLEVALMAVYEVSMRENCCSLRVCEVILNLLEIFLKLGILPIQTGNKEQEKDLSSVDTGSFIGNTPIDGVPKVDKVTRTSTKEKQEKTSFYLLLDILMRISKHLGCPHGCGEGHRSSTADALRYRLLSMLNNLHNTDQSQFRRFFQEMIKVNALTEIVDALHTFFGFCSEPGATLSPLGQKRTSSVSIQDTPTTSSRSNYGNNFRSSVTGPKGVEGIVLGYIFKHLVTRMVQSLKDLKLQENMALYCDIRQFVSFVRDNHGSTFRRVALSALLDTAVQRKKNKSTVPVTRIVRHMKSIDQEEYKEPLHSPTVFIVDETVTEKTSRKSFFRKKGVRKVPSAQSIPDERDDVSPNPTSGQTTPSLRYHHIVTPRLSVSDEDNLTVTPKNKSGHFQFGNWFKTDHLKQDHSEDDVSISPVPPESYPGSERLTRRASLLSHGTKLGHRSSSHMSLTLLRARKRVEDHLNKIGFARNKNKQNSFEEPLDLSRRNSCDLEHSLREGEFFVIKESKLVNSILIRNGMLRFSFLLETCQPGSLPDPPLLAALLDLKAPVISRAALYIECANFVHMCNKGHWPSWMKLNLPMFRPSGPLTNRGTPSGHKRTHIIQRSAGRLFYLWAEAIGARLEEILQDEQENQAPSDTVDENKGRQLRLEDEDEEFLDEVTVNQSGNACPFALKMTACQLLLEITAFLRETYQYLPNKTARFSSRDRHTFEPRSITANRRWSMALSSLGFSQNSAHSLVSLADQMHPIMPGERRISFVLHEADIEGESENSSNTTLTVQDELDDKKVMPGERRISFVLHEADIEGESENSSNTTLTVQDELDDKKGRRIGQVRPYLLRKGPVSGINSSFKRRSLKLKKTGDRKNRGRSSTFAEDDEEGGLRRTESIHSRRKVSAISDRSDTSERADVSGDESPGVLSDDQPPESPVDLIDANGSIGKNFPWLKVVVQLLETLNFSCHHQHHCNLNCHYRQIRACNRLSKALCKVYGEEFNFSQSTEKQHSDKEEIKKEKKLKKIITAPSSPLKRKASIPHNLDKLEHAMDIPYLPSRSLHSSTTHLAHDIEACLYADKGTQQKVDTSSKKKQEKIEQDQILKYLKSQVRGLFHSPLSMLIKGAVIMSDDIYKRTMSISWELLLESNQQLASSAAVTFILSSVKCPDIATKMIYDELHTEDPEQRVNSILRFRSLWKFRYQCWPNMEDGAHLIFKVPPPAIEFTSPSPKIAIESLPVADPPWMPHVKAKVEEVTINQEQSLQRSFVTATKTRRKQQMELVHNALQAEEEKKRANRENYHITSVPVCYHAAYEPALFHTAEEHEDDVGNEDNLTLERTMLHHMQIAQLLFPSCLCNASIHIINLLEDVQVCSQGFAVYEVAYQVIWNCLVEDTALFLRLILEKLTREKPDTMMQVIRRLLRYIPKLPAQAAYYLYNYLIGFIMFYVRTSIECSQEIISNALSVLWLVVPSVHGLFLKDLKQILRKEQCDSTLLITANIPSAKKIIVHGPDAGGIPSQFPVHEDTQFSHILQDSLDFFGIDEAQHNSYFLVDMKTNQMHSLDSYVRDYYFFKRSQYAQLSLIHMDPEVAFETLQKQAFTQRFLELGKVLMSLSILKSPTQVTQRVFFMHEELMKLPSFPRKALEADFSLYNGPLGKIGFIMFYVRTSIECSQEIISNALSVLWLVVPSVHGLFLKDLKQILRKEQCDSTLLITANIPSAKKIIVHGPDAGGIPSQFPVHEDTQFSHILQDSLDFFGIDEAQHNSYFLVDMKTNQMHSLDSYVRDYYFFKRSQYAQLSLIHMDPEVAFETLQKQAFTQRFLELGKVLMSLSILKSPTQVTQRVFFMHEELMKLPSFPRKALEADFSLYNGPLGKTILKAILPFYLKHLQILTTKKETPGGSRTELNMIHNIAVCIKTLISNCEALARNYTGPQRMIDLRGSSIKNASKGACSPPFEIDDDSHSKFMSDSYYSSRKQQQYEKEVEDSEMLRFEFRSPRDTLLSVVCEFYSKCSSRLADLSKKIPDLNNKATEILDVKCHLRLAEVAQSLLKVSPYDPVTMACRGLQQYMNELLPHSEWAQESMRPALIMVLRRLDKTFNKIAKKPAIRRLVDWNAARLLLKGIYLTLFRHPYIAHLPHLKSLIGVCQMIILGDQNLLIGADSSTNLPTMSALGQSPPSRFCSVVVSLVAMQMSALGEMQTLETVCGGPSILSIPEKMELYLMNLILPMCIRISSGIKDVPKLRQTDISFALTVILTALTPLPLKHSHQSSSTSGKRGNDSFQEKSPTRRITPLVQIAFLGLKIIIVCFEQELSEDWHRIACCIRELGNKMQGGLALWNFLDFVVTHRTPLYILLYPLIKNKMLRTICDNEQEYYYQQLIREKLQGFSLPTPKCQGSLFQDMTAEMKMLKEDLIAWKLVGTGEKDRLKSTLTKICSNSDVSHTTSYVYNMGSDAHCSSITELTNNHQSVTRLGNPSVMSSSASYHSPLTRELSTRSESFIPHHRGFSIRLHSIEGGHRIVERFIRRTSYPDAEGASSQEILDGEQSSSSEPRLFRKSTLHIKKRGSKKSISGDESASVGTIDTDERDDLGDVPLSPSSPHSPEQDIHKPKHRLQRQKAQSRKTFRFRKSRRGAGFAAHTKGTETSEQIVMVPTKKQPTLKEEEASTNATQTLPLKRSMSVEEPGEIKDQNQPTFHPTYKSPTTDVYLQCESTESLSNSENSSLLKKEQKQDSESSLLMVFPNEDDESSCI
ncbi:protein unc-80 homolog [Centruroides sculpturatus]|uniref:protein unc-80 homolog n=1 Tax=Centruroides sculpturatus TaxID=218467 RepID=UPI000C6C9516|nr:protein unc-80 homolog [Centruroides sculpturatus]